MIETFVNKPYVRTILDAVPAGNPVLRIVRTLIKAVIFRKRVVGGRRICFEGIEDVVIQKWIGLGPGPGEVLLETIATAVSPGTESGYFLDLPNFSQPRPYVPGYSGVGRVVASRTKVFIRGDLVAGILKHSSRNVVSANELVAVPEGVSPEEATFVTLGIIACTGITVAGINRGERVVVIGQGIIGQLVNQLARIYGAGEVIAVARTDSKKMLSLQSGVDSFIALDDSALDRRKEHGDRIMPRPTWGSEMSMDVAIDVTGSPPALEMALRMVKPKGTVVLLGSSPGYGEEGIWSRIVSEKEIVIKGAHIRNLQYEGKTYRSAAGEFLRLLADKKLKIDHLITDRYQPEEAPEIYQRLANGDKTLVGIAIDWKG